MLIARHALDKMEPFIEEFDIKEAAARLLNGEPLQAAIQLKRLKQLCRMQELRQRCAPLRSQCEACPGITS